MDETPDDLHRRIQEARAREERENPVVSVADKAAGSGPSGASAALRAATELSAAVGVGGYLGYVFDRHLHTKPWGMIVLLFMGFFAGLLNIYRAQTAPKKEETKKDK